MNDIKVGEEIWKPIKGYEGIYEISNKGRVKSLSRKVFTPSVPNKTIKEKILKPCIRSKNYKYYFVGLLKDKKRKYIAIHRLVADAFLPNPYNFSQADHLDGNKLNNNVDNLEWVTPKENTRRAWEKGLAKNSKHQREVARELMIKRWKSKRDSMKYIVGGKEK